MKMAADSVCKAFILRGLLCLCVCSHVKGQNKHIISNTFVNSFSQVVVSVANVGPKHKAIKRKCSFLHFLSCLFISKCMLINREIDRWLAGGREGREGREGGREGGGEGGRKGGRKRGREGLVGRWIDR